VPVGRREEDLAKALDPGGKPPQSRARDGIVLSIRPVCVYMQQETRLHVRSTSHIAAATVVCGPHQSCLCLRCPSLVCGTTLNTTTTATHTYRFVTSPSFNCAGVGVCGWLRGGGGLPFWVRCSMHHRARPPPLYIYVYTWRPTSSLPPKREARKSAKRVALCRH